MKTVVLGLALISAVAASAQAQAPRRAPTTSADIVVITGRVVMDSTGDPIRNARVTLSPESPQAPVVLTDTDGVFRFAAPATSVGRYRVVASKTGYAGSDATPAVAGQSVEVRLKHGAVISGRIMDERGELVVGVQVAALRQSRAGSKPTTVATTDTDDRGEYRLAGLSDGAVVVSVTTLAASGGRVPVPERRTIYYPGTATLGEAQALPLQPGDERSGADIVVPADRLAGMPAALFADRFLTRPTPPSGTPRRSGSIRGRVTNVDGAPIPLAHVFLFASTRSDSQMATTDEGGRFTFGEVVSGTVLITVIKSGYTQVESGQAVKSFRMNRASTTPAPDEVQLGRKFELSAGGAKRVDLQMARWNTLSGTVTDEFGDPIQGVGVEALRLVYEGGRWWLMSAGVSRFTDDLGQYRLYGLAPGQYIVSATVGQVSSIDVLSGSSRSAWSIELPGYGRTYFPGTPNAGEARYVSVGLAQDVGFVDFPMSRMRNARVAGIVLGPSGEPTMAGDLTLAPSQRSSSVTSVAVGVPIASDGTFVFPNVAPGEYVIQAYEGHLNDHTEGAFGAMRISVGDADVTGVVVRTSSGSSVTGRFRFDVADPRTTPKPSDFKLAAIPSDLDMSSPNNPLSVEIHRDGTFDMSGLNGPWRLQLVRTPPGFALEEIRVNGADMTDRPIPFGTRAQSLGNVEVVLTDRVAEFRGTVVDDRARPVVGAMVVVFSTDREQWYPVSRYLRDSAVGSDGTFTVIGLPPGNYYAAAIPAIPAGGDDAWQDPQFLESLIPDASTLLVAAGQKAVLALRLRSR